jgi:hypothetical protein
MHGGEPLRGRRDHPGDEFHAVRRSEAATSQRCRRSMRRDHADRPIRPNSRARAPRGIRGPSRPSANARHWPAEEQANAADPPRSPASSQHQGLPISRIGPTVAPLASPTTRHASSTTRRPRYSTTTTPSAGLERRQPTPRSRTTRERPSPIDQQPSSMSPFRQNATASRTAEERTSLPSALLAPAPP